jgi:hypothetical protein
MDGDVLLEVPARRLIVRERLFGGGESRLVLLDTSLEGLMTAGFVGDAPFGVADIGVEALERYQPLKVVIHGRGHQQKRPRRSGA